MTLRWPTVCCLVAASLLIYYGANAANVPAMLDTSFGSGGRTITDVGGPSQEDEPFNLVMAPDGRFLSVGKAFNKMTGNFDFTVLRYSTNGQLDRSFDADGIAQTDFGGHEEALDLTIQPDGKLVAGGLATNPGGTNDFALARYNTDGTLDSSFGAGGKVTTDFFGGSDAVLGVAVQPDAKLVAGGAAAIPGGATEFALARYNPDGSLDGSFGAGGKVTTDFSGSGDSIFGVALQPDGKVVGVGNTFNPSTSNHDFAIARYNPDGTLDSGFGGRPRPGLVTTDFFGRTDLAFRAALQSDGKLLVGGLAYSTATNSEDMALARYNADGTIDASFATWGAPGVVTADFFGAYDQILALAIQPDGKILAAGHAKHPRTNFDFALMRFTPDGTPDYKFGIAARYTINLFGGADGLHGLVLQRDGKAVAAGDSYNPFTGGDDFVLTRLLIADPSWTIAVVQALPESSFSSSSARSDLVSGLQAVQSDVTNNRISDAISKLRALRARMDGCGAISDADDSLTTCSAQQEVRSLIDQMIYKLSRI